MEVTKQAPEKEYPYLAVWTGDGETLGTLSISRIKTEDIVLISLLGNTGNDIVTYVQHILGGKEAYITKSENDYFPLPKGYQLKFIQ